MASKKKRKPSAGKSKRSNTAPTKGAKNSSEQPGPEGKSAEKNKTKKGKKSGKKSNRELKRPSLFVALALAVLSGVLDFLAFPGFDLWPLAFVALIPVLYAVDMTREGPDGPVGHNNRRVWLIALTYGAIGNVGGFYWIAEMLENFSGFGWFLRSFFTFFVCTYQGAMMALFVWLTWRCRKRGWPGYVIAPAAFASAELIWPLIFPFYHGNHLYDVPILIQIADLGGPMLVTGLIALINIVLYETGIALVRRQPVQKTGPIVAAASLLFTLGYGAYRIAEVDARRDAAPKLTVGLVQVNMGIFEKREDPLEGLNRHIQDSVALEQTVDLDLLVWPESAYNWFLPPNTTNVRDRVMGPVNTPLIFGGLQRREGEDRTHHYNTAFMVDENGEILGTYDKTFLLHFGEYLPLGETFPILYEWSPNSGRFTPGDHVRPLEWNGYRIAALVCYEDIIPRFVRSAVSEGNPHLLVNITNDAWFGDTTAPWEHLALARFRAIEHHRYLVRSTNSGVSAVVDPVGRMVTHSGSFTRETLHAEVAMMEGATVYQYAGDWFAYGSLVLIVFCSFRRRERPAVKPAAETV
ncbi:MAG: apolipoprotein N-acyltransferase [Myxococcota bacterium]